MNNNEKIEDILMPVLTGQTDEIYIDLVPQEVEEYLRTRGYIRERLRTYGEEFDFHLVFENGEYMKKYQLCGCWYTHTQKFISMSYDEV